MRGRTSTVDACRALFLDQPAGAATLRTLEWIVVLLAVFVRCRSPSTAGPERPPRP